MKTILNAIMAFITTGKGITTIAGATATIVIINQLWDKSITIPLNALIVPAGFTVGIAIFILKLTRR